MDRAGHPRIFSLAAVKASQLGLLVHFAQGIALVLGSLGLFETLLRGNTYLLWGAKDGP